MSTAVLPAVALRPTVAGTRTPTVGQRLSFIDALRGLAALAVATYHIHRYGPLHEAADSLTPAPLAWLFEHGWMGVQFFFVISGFVIAYSLRDAVVTPRYLANFALRRSIRLDPPYWMTIAVVLVLYLLGGPLQAVDPLTDPPALGQLLAHPFYVQDILGSGNLSVGFWSLCVEVQFYLLLVAMIGASQWLAYRTASRTSLTEAAWLLVLATPLAIFSLAGYEPGGRFDVWIVHFFCMFFLGVLVCLTVTRRVPARLFWIYLALMLVRVMLDWSLEIACAAAAGGVIYFAAWRGGLNRWLSYGWLQYLGRISYSLYLIHYPVSWLVVGIGYRLTGTVPAAALAWHLLALALSIAAAHLLYTWVEAPSMALSRKLKPRVPTVAPALEPSAAAAGPSAAWLPAGRC